MTMQKFLSLQKVDLEKRQVHHLNQFGAFGLLAHALTLHEWYYYSQCLVVL